MENSEEDSEQASSHNNEDNQNLIIDMGSAMGISDIYG